MAGQQVDVILVVLMHASSFRYYIADILVIPFQTSFLIGNVRITVKHFGPKGSGFVSFDVPGILKLGSVVGKDDGKILLKRPGPDRITEIVNGIDNAALGAVGKQEQYHEGAASEQQCKQAFSLVPAAFDSIHFHYAKFRESLCIALKVGIGSLVAVSLRDVPGSRFGPFLALFVTDTAWKVDVPCSKDSPVQIVIKRSPAYRDLITVNSKYVA